MPRIALSRASLAALQAEIERRKGKLAQLIAERDSLTDQIAEIEALVGPQQAVRLGKKPGPKPGRKAKAPAAKKRRKRGVFNQTGEQMLLELLSSGKILTTAELNQAWSAAGRGGSADTALGKLVKAKRLKRRKIRGKKGSRYTWA